MKWLPALLQKIHRITASRNRAMDLLPVANRQHAQNLMTARHVTPKRAVERNLLAVRHGWRQLCLSSELASQ